MSNTIEYYLDALRTYGQTVLVCDWATRANALELRKLAKQEGLKVTFRKTSPRCIGLYVQR